MRGLEANVKPMATKNRKLDRHLKDLHGRRIYRLPIEAKARALAELEVTRLALQTLSRGLSPEMFLDGVPKAGVLWDDLAEVLDLE